MTDGADNGSGMIRPTAWPSHKPSVEVRHRCEVVATTRQGVIDQLVEVLSAEGYFVSKKVAWEKTGEFRKRMNLNHEALLHILESPVCPPVELHRGKGWEGQKGRLLAISSNPVFEAFVVALRGKTPDRSAPKPRPSRRKPAHLLKRARMHGSKRNYVTT
jgi:hypothetical protein